MRTLFVRGLLALALPTLVSCNRQTPAAVEEPEPEAVAAPAPAATTAKCTLPRGTGAGVNCPRHAEGDFVRAVDAAIDRVIAKNPSFFDMNDRIGGDQPRIVNPDAYLRAVPVELEAAGYCAIFDGKEIAVKNTNSYSEQYHIWYSAGYVRRGDGAYRATCEPAWF